MGSPRYCLCQARFPQDQLASEGSFLEAMAKCNSKIKRSNMYTECHTSHLLRKNQELYG